MFTDHLHIKGLPAAEGGERRTQIGKAGPVKSGGAEFSAKLAEKLPKLQTHQHPGDEAHRNPEAERQDGDQQERRTEVG